VAATGADCVFLSASLESHATALATALGAALPAAKIFAADGVANDAFLDPARGGIPLSLDPRVYVTLAPVAEREYPPASRAFFAAYRSAYGTVQPYAIFGYAAMTLMLRAIDRATHHGRRVAYRPKVLAAIFATRDRRSVLGTYSIAANGDTSLRRYGAYGVSDGRLVFLRTFEG
jgi:branched-chain amino acid transport system substrate-binding protein